MEEKTNKNWKKSINLSKKPKKKRKNQTGEANCSNSTRLEDWNRDNKTHGNSGYGNLGKWTTEASITNRIQEMEERISGVEDTIEEIDSSVKNKAKQNPTKS